MKTRRIVLLLSIWAVVIVVSCKQEVIPEPTKEVVSTPKKATARSADEIVQWWLWDLIYGFGASPYWGTPVASGTTLTVVYNNVSGPATHQFTEERKIITYVKVVAQSCDLTTVTATRNGTSVSQTTFPNTSIPAFRVETPYDGNNTGFSEDWVITVTPSNAWVELAVFAGTTGYPVDHFNDNGFSVANNTVPFAKVGGTCGSGRTWSITQPNSSVNRLTTYTYTLSADAACAKDNTVVVNIKNTGQAPFKIKYFNGVFIDQTLSSSGGERDFNLPLIPGCTGTTPSVTYTVQYDQITASSTIVNSIKSVSSGHSIGSSKTQSGPF